MPILYPFAGLLIGLASLFLAIVGYALLKSTQAWLRPLVHSPPKSKSFLNLVPLGPFNMAKRVTYYLAKHAEHYVKVALSRFVAGQMGPTALFFTSFAHLVNHYTRELAGLAEDTAATLHLVKRREIPRQIVSRTAVIKRDAHAAHQRATHVDVREREHAKRFETGIDRLRTDLHSVSRDLHGIDEIVRGGRLRARLRTAERELDHVISVDMPRVKAWEREGKQTIVRHGSRLRRLEKLLAVGALAAVVTNVLLRRMPWMRCGGFSRLSRLIRCRHLDFLADLLGRTAFGVLFFENICRVIELTAAVAARVMPKLVEVIAAPAAALCDGRHQAAPPLRLTTTDLPKPSNPLPIG